MLLCELFGNLNLIQVIDQPTHFRPGCNPSCIDLITTSEPNHILESGVLPTLVDTCHHQITFAKIDFNVIHAPPYKRMIWNYDLADVTNIKKCLNDIDWNRHFNGITVNQKVKFLTDSILNIFLNYCPHKYITVRGKDASWMTTDIKTILKEKTKLYKKYVKNGFCEVDKTNLN